MPHFPLVHVAAPCAGIGHALPHAPQFSGSLCSLAQLSPHGENSPTQAKLHCESMHTALPLGGAVHLAPQPRQLSMSLLSTAQRPPQTVSPSPHVTGPSLGARVGAGLADRILVNTSVVGVAHVSGEALADALRRACPRRYW